MVWRRRCPQKPGGWIRPASAIAGGRRWAESRQRRGGRLKGSRLLWLVPLVAAGCGREESAPKASTPAPPVVAEVSIVPAKAYAASILTAQVRTADPEGRRVEVHYQWLRNGAEIPGASGSTLVARDLRKGDLVAVRVTASDGDLTTAPSDSAPVAILNSPPRVVAAPVGRSSPDGQLTYQIAAEDPDGDTLTYTLSPNAPRGMTIHPGNGTIVWRPGSTDAGTHRFMVTISDGDGGVVQQEVIVTVGGRS